LIDVFNDLLTFSLELLRCSQPKLRKQKMIDNSPVRAVLLRPEKSRLEFSYLIEESYWLMQSE
jgi:hypothetical protein